MKKYLKDETKRDQFVEYDRSIIIGENFKQGELDCVRKVSDWKFQIVLYMI